MRRREFITLLGSAAAWPLAARAQQADRMRRIGVLMLGDETDPVRGTKGWLSTFTRRLAELGWIDGRNMRIDLRWGENDADRARRYAQELVALAPDIFLAEATVSVTALQQQTRTIPIVFVMVSDPIGSGFVASLPRPGRNITGFMWRANGWAEIETVIGSLGGEPGGGLVIAPDGFTTGHRSVIISLATQNNVPAVSSDAAILRDGGLLSYGPDLGDMFHRAALYVDRILRGARPDELPVQLPIKFVMAINLKTAKALGLDVPWFLQQRADEVIE